jgi:hypothetical protein
MEAQEEKALIILDQHLTVFEQRLYDHISSTFKWLIATLFAANGGGLLSLTQTQPNALASVPSSAWWFAFGLTCSILVGILSSLIAIFSNRDITVTRTQIQVAALTGNLDDGLRAKLSIPKKPSIWIWSPTAIGLLSFFAFIVGMISRLTH